MNFSNLKMWRELPVWKTWGGSPNFMQGAASKLKRRASLGASQHWLQCHEMVVRSGGQADDSSSAYAISWKYGCEVCGHHKVHTSITLAQPRCKVLNLLQTAIAAEALDDKCKAPCGRFKSSFRGVKVTMLMTAQPGHLKL